MLCFFFAAFLTVLNGQFFHKCNFQTGTDFKLKWYSGSFCFQVPMLRILYVCTYGRSLRNMYICPAFKKEVPLKPVRLASMLCVYSNTVLL